MMFLAIIVVLNAYERIFINNYEIISNMILVGPPKNWLTNQFDENLSWYLLVHAKKWKTNHGVDKSIWWVGWSKVMAFVMD